ncbi:hypothetical protein B0H67DRAFT_580271 [Lasiosphaeris hirsuta]|uniref:Uncharacterized protein n=1 Tax=Lasiosphaeris hirsuta TaxID=260670 RepID=A0AA40AGD4_9PEZI|nr:hypothetical protein B0H67DRAFT_580271 [Lasiosphaeris hirsuta]
MWLINTKTLGCKDFLSEKTPPCAILSHTWGEGEGGQHDRVPAPRSASLSSPCTPATGSPKFVSLTSMIGHQISAGLIWNPDNPRSTCLFSTMKVAEHFSDCRRKSSRTRPTSPFSRGVIVQSA